MVAVDRATGEERWRGPANLDQGTPAVVRLGERVVVHTPDGHALYGADGAVLATGLGDTCYLGPLVWDDTVWWGGRGDTELDGAVGLRGVR